MRHYGGMFGGRLMNYLVEFYFNFHYYKYITYININNKNNNKTYTIHLKIIKQNLLFIIILNKNVYII